MSCNLSPTMQYPDAAVSLLPHQEGSRLRRRAFHDAPFLTTSLKVIKSFILNADVHRGPQFLRFKVCATPITCLLPKAHQMAKGNQPVITAKHHCSAFPRPARRQVQAVRWTLAPQHGRSLQARTRG